MILIGTPSYNGTVTFGYMTSVMDMITACSLEGIQVGLQQVSGENLIPRARNFIANAFLRQKQFSHLLFIDADIEFPAAAATRYLHSDKDVVCGIYPVKKLDLDRLRKMPDKLSCDEAVAATLNYSVMLQKENVVVKDGFVPIQYGSAGFMMIKRLVFEKIMEANPSLLYHKSYINSCDDEYDNWAFFDPAIDQDKRDYLPEDYAFCKRWTDLGGRIYGDVLSHFTHSGRYDYTGDYPTYLRNFKVGGE
jgi:hypothetical protein